MKYLAELAFAVVFELQLSFEAAFDNAAVGVAVASFDQPFVQAGRAGLVLVVEPFDQLDSSSSFDLAADIHSFAAFASRFKKSFS